MTAVSALWKKVVSAVRRRTINMKTEADWSDESWYQNPWVWLIIAIPSLTVVGGLITLYLALSRPVYLVSDTAIEEETLVSPSR